MKKFFLSLTLLVLFVIQTSIGDKLKIFSVSPNLILIFVILFSMNASILKSAIAGLICGLLTDSVGFWVIGYNALFMMYIGILTSVMSSRYYFETKLTTFIIVFVFTFIFGFINTVVSSVIVSKLPVWYITYRYILFECVYNSYVALVISPLIKRLKIEYVRGI